MVDVSQYAEAAHRSTPVRRPRPSTGRNQLTVVPARAFTTERLLTWDLLPAPVGSQPGAGPRSTLAGVDTLLRVGDHRSAVDRIDALLADSPGDSRDHVALLARLAIAHQAQGADGSAVSAVALAERLARRSLADGGGDLEATALVARVAAALTLHDVACRLFGEVAGHPDAAALLPRIAVHRALAHLHRALLLDLHGEGLEDWTIARTLADSVVSDPTASPQRRGAAAAVVSITAHRLRGVEGADTWSEPTDDLDDVIALAARDTAHRALGRNALVLHAVGDGDLEAATKAITTVRREGHASVLPLLEAHVRDAFAELLSAHGLGYTASAERRTARALRRDADWAARTARATWLAVASAPLVTSI